MKLRIINNCVNCGACLIVCPSKAIIRYKPIKGSTSLPKVQFFIIRDNCNNCEGYSGIPLCMEICPMDSIRK